jgi:prevent-host-death family protein
MTTLPHWEPSLFSEKPMNRVQLRDAKAKLSEVVDAAQRGEPTTITRHGKPVAVVVSIDDADRLFPDRRTFLDMLLEMPEDLELVRDVTPLRAAKLG